MAEGEPRGDAAEEIGEVGQARVMGRVLASVSRRGLGWVLGEQPGPTGEPKGDPAEEMLIGE